MLGGKKLKQRQLLHVSLIGNNGTASGPLGLLCQHHPLLGWHESALLSVPWCVMLGYELANMPNSRQRL